MTIEITIRGEIGEIEEEFGISIQNSEQRETETDTFETNMSEEERMVLQVVRENSGHALRTIHKEAAKIEGSPWEFSGDWDDDRTKVQEILGRLRQRNIVRVDDRSYYPTEQVIEA